MARIPLHTIEDAPPASGALLESIVHASPTGQPLNMQAQMAEAPAVLSGYVSLRRAVDDHGTLEPRHRAAVMVVAAATLGVPYVEAVTAMLARRAGWTEDEAAGLRAGASSGHERLDALLDVIRVACRNFGDVDDRSWARALDRAWTTEELTESLAYVAVVLYCAFFVNFARTEPDLPATAGVASS